MSKNLEILGDGQIWDLQGVVPFDSQKTFEDLFSGRALGEMAQAEKVFCRFKEKGKITGLSVTKALLSHSPAAKKEAKTVLQALAKNGALGIEALTKGKGFKKNWSGRQKSYWKNIDIVVIGGGVSEGKTGRLLVNFIKRYLSQDGFSKIKVYQAKFPGKEAGVLGAVINIIKLIGKEAKRKGLRKIIGMGLDLGRDDIGVGLLAINPRAEKILKQQKHYWLFNSSVKAPYKKYLKNFLDWRQDYTKAERQLGKRIRSSILKRMGDLIIQAQTKAQGLGLVCSDNIAVAVPGSVGGCGSILNSTDYLPFFRKKDGFNFTRSLENFLRKKTLHNYRVYIINDGIAAGVANIYFLKTGRKKFAFLGVGSGLGGCVGRIEKMKKNRLTITLIIPHYQNMFSTFYTLEIIKEVSEVAIRADVDLLIATSWNAPLSSGILFADMLGNEEWVKKARKRKIPYLILNYYDPHSEYNCIGIDNKKAAFAVVDYLIRAGHRHIAMITGKLNAQAGIQRLQGFKEALKAAKIDLEKRYIFTGDWSQESGRKAMQKLLSLAKLPSAVFVAGDEMAIGAMEAARQAGLKIPEDISFVGFDNIPQGQLAPIPLTTVEQPFADLASLGIKSLAQIIQEKPKQPVQILLDNTRLIKRSSVKEISPK